MGASASLSLLAGAVNDVQSFVSVFIYVYTLVIFAYIITSWLRLPYSVALNRIQRFLFDVCEPYLRLFRRVLPSMGGLDLSPMVAVFVLLGLKYLIVNLILGRYA